MPHHIPSTGVVDFDSGAASFYLINKNITLLGGYAASGGAARNPSLNRTKLKADGHFHVLLTINLDATAVIDGLEIRDGSATDLNPQTVGAASISSLIGGGLYNHASSPTVKNCFFLNNYAIDYGGGVANMTGSSPTFSNCVFSENGAGKGGGGGYSPTNSTAICNNTVFNKNGSATMGGAWYTAVANATLNLNSCTLYDNYASENTGGGIYNVGNLTVKNSIFYNNKYFNTSTFSYITSGNGTDIENFGGTISIQNSMLQSTISCTDCISTNNQNPLFRNTLNLVGVDGKWGTADDGLNLGCGSPAKDKGNTALATSSFDVIGAPRISAGVIDLGAYESDWTAPTIMNHPTDLTLCNGDNLSFSVTATGRQTLRYQWQKKITYAFENIVGATSATYTKNAIDSTITGDYYRCIVTDNCPLTSNAALVIVNTLPVFLTQPDNQSACANSNVVFKAFAETYDQDPVNVTYQWQENSGGGFSNISGQTSATLTLNGVALSINNKEYRCIATSACGNVTSSSAKLQVHNYSIAYVDVQAVGANDGSSWVDAFTSLQSAIELFRLSGYHQSSSRHLLSK